MQKSWYFVRHGETDYNKRGIVQGSGVDSSLNDTGRQQAKAFYEKYKAISFNKIICSKLKRTKETVSHFIDAGIPWEQTASINEMNWGIHEGEKSQPWMIENYKNMIKAWGEGDLDARVEKGESAKELIERCKYFLKELKNTEEQQILICAHGRSLRCLLMLLKNQSVAEMELYRPGNTAVYKYTIAGDEVQVDFENNLQHLQ